MRIVITCVALAAALMVIGCNKDDSGASAAGKVSTPGGDKLGQGAAAPAVKMAPTPPPQKR